MKRGNSEKDEKGERREKNRKEGERWKINKRGRQHMERRDMKGRYTQ